MDWEKVYLGETQAESPLLEGDEVVVVSVASVEEGSDAVLEGHERSADREQFVAGYFSVVRVSVQIAEFPDCRVGPPAALILLGFTLQLQEVRTQVVTVSQIPHHVHQPVTHAPREIGQFVSCALLICDNLQVTRCCFVN